MELLFMIALGSMIVFNGALIVYYLGNAFIIPQFFPQFHTLGFGHSIVFVLLGIFLFITLFGNRISQRKKLHSKAQKQNPASRHFGEKRR